MKTQIEGRKTGSDLRRIIKVWQPLDLKEIELQRGFSVNRPVPRHWHDEYQICLVETGTGDLTYRGASLLTPPASLFIVHPGEVHSNSAFEHGGCNFRTIFIEPKMMQRIMAEIETKEKTAPFFSTTVIFDKDILRQFMGLHSSLEYASSTLERQVLLQNLLVNLIGRFSENPQVVRSFNAERKAVNTACDYLVENYAENVFLEDLASIAKLSPFHFNRLFSEQFGMPPHAFQTQLRVTRAKTLLRQNMTIAQIALHTGFADQSHLNRHFKRLVGVTPGYYKQNSKNIQDSYV